MKHQPKRLKVTKSFVTCLKDYLRSSRPEFKKCIGQLTDEEFEAAIDKLNRLVSEYGKLKTD